jgi:arylsulfatase A-like enzyme
VALLAGTFAGLAAAIVDVGFAVAGPGSVATADLLWLVLSALTLLSATGLAVGIALRTTGQVLGQERRDALVRALAGEPKGALAAHALSATAGAGVALGGGGSLAALAFAHESPATAAAAVAVSLALGLATFYGTRRLLARAPLASPLWVIGAGAALAALGIVLATAEGAPLEALDARPLWAAIAAVAAGLGSASLLARRRRPRLERRWAPRLVAAAVLAGAVPLVVVCVGADPEVRAASERTALTGPLLDRARAFFAQEDAPGAVLRRLAELGSRSPETPFPGSPPRGTAAGPPTRVAHAEDPYHLVLLTIDALRADHVGAYGYRRPVTPVLDAFASRATLFERAYSQETKTKGSIASLLTSRFPSDLQWGGVRYVPLGESEVTLAARLLRAGYHTAAFVTHSYFLPSYRLDRGFAHYDTALISTDPEVAFGRPTSSLLADRVLAHLGRLPPHRPFFLWAHFFDPHHRYLRHPGFSRYGERPMDRYDGEIAYSDHHLGRVLDALSRHPEAARIAVLISSDHGEAFGEHGKYFHGQTLFEEETRIPLLLAIPGLAPRRVGTPVALIDVVPTLLDLAGLALPPELRGRSLVPAARGDPFPDVPVYSEILPEDRIGAKSTVVLRDWKLHYDERKNLLRLYNLERDPGEVVNLLRQEPLVASELAAALFRWRARPVPPGTTPLAAERARSLH